MLRGEKEEERKVGRNSKVDGGFGGKEEIFEKKNWKIGRWVKIVLKSNMYTD